MAVIIAVSALLTCECEAYMTVTRNKVSIYDAKLIATHLNIPIVYTLYVYIFVYICIVYILPVLCTIAYTPAGTPTFSCILLYCVHTFSAQLYTCSCIVCMHSI